MIPLEIEIPYLRVSLKDIINEEDQQKERLQQLEALDEKRINAFEHLRAYHTSIKREYDKKIKPKEFQIVYFVLLKNMSNTTTSQEHKGKFQPNWVCPYLITTNFVTRAYKLSYLEGREVKKTYNRRYLK